MFPGDTLAWNGTHHEVVIECFGVETHAERDVPVAHEAVPVRALLLIGGVVVLAIGAFALRRRR